MIRCDINYSMQLISEMNVAPLRRQRATQPSRLEGMRRRSSTSARALRWIPAITSCIATDPPPWWASRCHPVFYSHTTCVTAGQPRASSSSHVFDGADLQRPLVVQPPFVACTLTAHAPLHVQASLYRYEEALEDAKKVVELKPDWPKGYSRVGAAALGAEHYDEAIAAYEKGARFGFVHPPACMPACMHARSVTYLTCLPGPQLQSRQMQSIGFHPADERCCLVGAA